MSPMNLFKKIIVSLGCVTLVVVGAAACGSDKPSHSYTQADCKARMTQDLAQAKTVTQTPKECQGLSATVQQKLAGEVMENSLSSASAQPSDSPSTLEISPTCHAWLETELTDSTDSVDTTTGDVACKGLSSDEMDQAIDQVASEIEAAQ